MNTPILPQAFINRMKDQLGEEFDSFFASYADSRLYGLRCNLLKSEPASFTEVMPFSLTGVDWAGEGFYYPEDERPGRHAYHEAGAYYIQEPSAMSAVALLDPKPGDKVADLCAAPGGKSTQIAARLGGEGLLVTNEIISSRAAVLSSNIERLGVRNVLVTNESTDKLATFFPGFFDKILVDAPCSGEGMFRKDETAIKEWSPENVSLCAERQKEILNNASRMCRPGGIIVYSTCTFSEAENEDNVRWFLNEHPEFNLESSERLMPHKIKGEGHFVAKFVKTCNISCKASEIDSQNEFKMTETNRRSKNSKAGNGKSGTASDVDIRKFLTEECKIAKESVDTLFENSVLNTFGDNYYLTPTAVSSLKGLTVVRPGLQICKDLKNRFEPSHSLAMSLRPYEVSTMVNLDISNGNKYIEGQTVNCDSSLKGWVCVFINGYSIGWGKASNGILKNHYPKGLRRVI